MSVKLRLRRVGAKKQPAYRIVAADSRAPRDGRFIEIVGAYNPLTNPATVQVNEERALYWLRNGAQPTDVVVRLFRQQGVWSQFTGEPMPEKPAAPAPEPVAAPAPEPVVVETPVTEQPAVEEEAPAAEETPAEAPAVEEAPAAEETTEETPAE